MTADLMLEALDASMELMAEFAGSVPEDALAQRLPGLRSNTVGAQLWCVVGARESYARAIAGGKWDGFACSLSGADVVVRKRLVDALRAAAAAVRDAAAVARDAETSGEVDDARLRLLIALLEHESAHQGQLIRYLYGLDLPVPAGWKKRHALD